jgi:hypothetical protein
LVETIMTHDPDDGPTTGEDAEADAMEQVQEDAAEERENNGGYQ